MSKNKKSQRKPTKMEKRIAKKVKNLTKQITKLDKKRIRLAEKKKKLLLKLIQRRQELANATKKAKQEEHERAGVAKSILKVVMNKDNKPVSLDTILDSIPMGTTKEVVKATIKALVKEKKIKGKRDGYIIKAKKVKKEKKDKNPVYVPEMPEELD